MNPSTTKQKSTALARGTGEHTTPTSPAFWVEVTHSDGTIEVMSPDDYNRLTSTDTAHQALRMISAAQAAGQPRRRINA